MKRILALLFLALFLHGPLAAREKSPKEASQAGYRTEHDIAYRDAAGDAYADSLCRLDLYYPIEKKGFPTIVWFHGGSLKGGKRDIPEALQQHGFAIAGVDYRLTPRVQVADCIDDAAAAVAWVLEHIASYGGDPRSVFIAGHSAGGYLVTMLGLDKRWMGRYGIDPDKAFAAVIPYSGQVVTHFARRRELGIAEPCVIVDDMAPLYHVRPDCPPMLLLAGDRELELKGRYEEIAYFCRMMRIAQHPDIRLYEFQGFKHGNMPQAGHFVALRYMREILKKRGAGNE